MGYVEHRPTGLEGWAECVWERRAGPTTDVARVIPDGCMDLVWSPRRGLLVVGPNTTAFLAALPAESTGLGVRLHPGCAPPLFGASAEALRDASVPANELWGDAGARLEDAVWGAPGAHGQRRALLNWLAGRARGRAPDPLVRLVARRLAIPTPSAVPALAADLGLSERQLRRRIVSQVGYGPKRLARVLRLRRALAEARAGAALAEVAFAAGYADQAHFTNDCGDLAGASPRALLGA